MTANERRERDYHRGDKSAAAAGQDKIRLEPLSKEEFEVTRNRAIPGLAADYVRRGIWTRSAALGTSQEEFAQLLPQGLATQGKHLCKILDSETGQRLGEAWYTVQVKGGKVQFWIDWITIEPEHRRRGYATRTLRLLEDEARRLGADRTGLSVWMDNPGALALYRKIGYTTAMMRMVKLLNPRSRRPPPARTRKRPKI
jgi:ribosomal protein S18 acetylase RimI-like enzyme